MGAKERVVASGLEEEDFEQQRSVLRVRDGEGDNVVTVAENGEVDREGTPAAVGDFRLEHRRRPRRLAEICVKEGERKGKGYWRCAGSGGWRRPSCGTGRERRPWTLLFPRTSPSACRETWNRA